jgi:hypothetical protein
MPSPRDVPVPSNATRCKGPDFEGQIRRLRSGDGVHFTTAGALKLAHYGRLQDDQPAARRGAYRGSLRGDHVRGQTGPRSREGLRGQAGNSWMFENRVPHVLAGDYTQRSAVDKDLGIIQDMARSAKFPVPLAAAALQMFLMAAGAGMGGDDDSSLARLYARVSGTSLPGAPAS